MAARIKKGDKVIVIAGKDKGKIGDVLAVSPKENKVLVSGVNVAKIHKKPTMQAPGQIVETEKYIDISNVSLVEDGKPVKVRFEIRDGKVNESLYNDAKFNEMNALLENFKREDEKIFFEYTSTMHDKCQFTFENEKLTFTKGQIVESFENAGEFVEYANMVSKAMPIHEKMNFMKVTNMVAKVYEGISNVVVLDCSKILSTSTGTICAITEAQDNCNLTVFRSYNAGTSVNNYEYVIEALNNVTKISGVDLKHLYEERINEDCKKQDPEGSEEIEKALKESKEAQIQDRKKQIAMLAEKYKNDPAKITLLNSLARELSLLQ
jgi:large subunit ribosomal protein L24